MPRPTRVPECETDRDLEEGKSEADKWQGIGEEVPFAGERKSVDVQPSERAKRLKIQEKYCSDFELGVDKKKVCVDFIAEYFRGKLPGEMTGNPAYRKAIERTIGGFLDKDWAKTWAELDENEGVMLILFDDVVGDSGRVRGEISIKVAEGGELSIGTKSERRVLLDSEEQSSSGAVFLSEDGEVGKMGYFRNSKSDTRQTKQGLLGGKSLERSHDRRSEQAYYDEDGAMVLRAIRKPNDELLVTRRQSDGSMSVEHKQPDERIRARKIEGKTRRWEGRELQEAADGTLEVFESKDWYKLKEFSPEEAEKKKRLKVASPEGMAEILVKHYDAFEKLMGGGEQAKENLAMLLDTEPIGDVFKDAEDVTTEEIENERGQKGTRINITGKRGGANEAAYVEFFDDKGWDLEKRIWYGLAGTEEGGKVVRNGYFVISGGDGRGGIVTNRERIVKRNRFGRFSYVDRLSGSEGNRRSGDMAWEAGHSFVKTKEVDGFFGDAKDKIKEVSEGGHFEAVPRGSHNDSDLSAVLVDAGDDRRAWDDETDYKRKPGRPDLVEVTVRHSGKVVSEESRPSRDEKYIYRKVLVPEKDGRAQRGVTKILK